MKIKTKKPKWQDIDGESQFYIDYPVIEQQDEVDLIISKIMLLDDSLQGVTNKKEMEGKLNSFSIDNKAMAMQLQKVAGRLAIKYTVKDWKGVSGDNDKPMKIKLVPWINSEGKEEGTQIEEKLYKKLIQNLSWWELIHIYNCIYQVIGFTETDKKK